MDLAYHFQDKRYGESCKEINFQTFCINPEFDEYKDLLDYFQHEKAIDVSLLHNLRDISVFERKGQYMEYLIKTYIDKIGRFAELNIANFNHDQFQKDFEAFSTDYMKSYIQRDEPITDRK